MKVAGMAEAFNLPVVSHLFPEIHVHLVAAAPNGLTVEYMPWSLQVVRGGAAPGERRARRALGARDLGLRFDRDVIARYGVR